PPYCLVMSHCPIQFAFGQPHMEANRTLFGGEQQLLLSEEIWSLDGQSLKEIYDYSCEVELRRAAIQRGAHRLTINPVLTLRERHRRFLTAAKPICLRPA